MAQLKDTLITGGLRVTDTTITNVLLTSAIKAPVDSASGTIGLGSNGLVLTSDGTNTYWSSDILAVNDAMVFKGTLGTGGTITAVPTNGYSAGWTYRIITAGVYAGEYCEEGDLLIAINDCPSSGSSVIAADWTRALTNIEAPVFRGKTGNSPTAFTNNRLIYSTSTSGLVASADNLYYDGTNLILQNDLNLYTADNDRYINFTYNNNTAESEARWRLGYEGTGGADANIFVLLSTGSSSSLGSKKEFSDVLSITMNTHHITASNSLTIKGGTAGSTALNNGLWIYNPGTTSVKYASLYTGVVGVANTSGEAVLSLGNSTAKTAANNARGRIIIYGDATAATRLESAITGSTSYTMYLPDYAGDGYLVHTSGKSKVGDTTLPVYIAANGRVTATNYTINANVPSDAVFTDTKNTAGSTNTSSKIFLIGATSQAANPQTYSDDQVYVTNGVLDAKEVSTSKLYIYGNKTTDKTNRFLYSDLTTNMYASIDGVISLVLTKTEVRRGASATTVNLGSFSHPWHNTYTETLFISDTTDATKSNSSTFAALDVEGGAQIAKTLAAKSIIIDNNAATNCTMLYDETLQTLKFVFT